ncbi:MAG: hypothetical protein WBB01_00585 [Phormidesmis sp.]
MPTLLKKFRSQYPEGCLSADLVSMHDGQYVVRAAIVLQGKTLATGLAASADVQIAEDRARDRAIAALGIVADQAQSIEAPSDFTRSQNEQGAVGSSTTPFNEPAEITALPVPLPDTASDAADDFDLPIDEIADESAAAAKSSAATRALENFSTSAHPVDLSDVIAQTDVELTRLGWTSAQGRHYLEKTYGKISRTQLTDEELMSFLLYLEDQ